MAELPELITFASALAVVLSLVVHYRLLMKSGSGLFAYSLLIATAITVATLAAALAPANTGAQAITDVGILMAGALAFAASGWLIFAFGMAGGASGR